MCSLITNKFKVKNYCFNVEEYHKKIFHYFCINPIYHIFQINKQSELHVLFQNTHRRKYSVKNSFDKYRNSPPSVSWDTSSVPMVIARIRDHWFIANVPVGTLN